jgi:exopolysaccharide production protein ExoQ
MPPFLALLLTVGFVVFLYWRDIREQPPVTGALWIPLLWFLIIATRSVSQWLGFGGGDDLVEGSPLDRAVFLFFELAGLAVLFQRRVSLQQVLSANKLMTLFLAYGALSILWSDFPVVALKRYFKFLSHPIMVLVIASEPNPREALVRLLKRAAYILVPFSILLIKYYPHLGRSTTPWGGVSNTGVVDTKNGLGYDCLLLGLFFAWHLLTTLSKPKSRNRSEELIFCVGFLAMIAWLLSKAQSATSFAALALGVSILLLLHPNSTRTRHTWAYLLAVMMAFSIAELLFDATDIVIVALGRDQTLTGRADLWELVLHVNPDPIFGTGFESFWLGDRLAAVWEPYWWKANQAHNGYLETYLNLGWIGVILLAAWILVALSKAMRLVREDFDGGRFDIAVILVTVVYNYTEATFKGLHPLLFFFFIAALDHRRIRSGSAEPRRSAGPSRPIHLHELR